ncbi:hypothetical protein FRB90_000637 [Tulasnella sp. 427]|nr:hypothetical protein FRB90_000637 [Tulasnella sp. 427]
MVITQNSSVILAARPDGTYVPGKHLVVAKDLTIDLDTVSLDGGLLVKTIGVSVDPYYRIKMDGSYPLGKPISGHIVGRVIRSEIEEYKAGDYVYTEGAPFQEYAIVSKDASKLSRIDKNAATWAQYLGALGMVARTAWIGFHGLADAKKGETIYVSTAAGGVGSIVAQLAKQRGLKVIGSTGSDEKVKYLKEELGIDVAFNYKKEEIGSVLEREGPVDIYWDHIGGKTLETVISKMNRWGRAIIAGFIEEYDGKETTGVRNLSLVDLKELTLVGFNVNSLEARKGDFGFTVEVPKLIREGKLTIREDIRYGLEVVPQFLLDILEGKNNGKAVVIVADE